MLSVFASDATVAVLADWAELDHWASRRGRSTDSHVLRADRLIHDEPEHGERIDSDTGEWLEIEILDETSDERRQRLWDELSRRQEALGGAYPFILSKTNTGWALETRTGGSPGTKIARFGYLLSLLFASYRHQHIERGPDDADELSSLVQTISFGFQALAVLAAGNLFGPATRVYWFGWPRPDGSPFRSALYDLVGRMGVGAIREPAPYNTRFDQDATVDLIAWRPFADADYGAIVLYGQVASGVGWREKAVHTHIRDRFFQHFTDLPATRYLGATFMPFVLNTAVAVPKDGNLAGAVRDQARSLEASHGVLLDRLRIAELMGAGINSPDLRFNTPDLGPLTRSAIRWVSDTRKYCER